MLGGRLFSIILILLTVFVGSFWFSSTEVQALGISPPLVRNHQLLRGSHFESTVYLSQGEPQALKGRLTLGVSDKIRNWITIQPSGEFDIPAVKLFPIKVIVDVPADAELGNYTGEIKITTQPANLEEGQVTIGIGAAIALDLRVAEKEIIDFSIIVAKVEPMEEGWPVRISFLINNKGNTAIKPQKVFLEVLSDLSGEFLWSGQTPNLNSIESFQTGNSIAEFPVDLKAGSYRAQLKVYKTESEILEYQIPFRVLEKGTLPRPGKPWFFWPSLGIGALLFIFLAYKFRRFFIVIINKIIYPFIIIKRKFVKIIRVLREKE